MPHGFEPPEIPPTEWLSVKTDDLTRCAREMEKAQAELGGPPPESEEQQAPLPQTLIERLHKALLFVLLLMLNPWLEARAGTTSKEHRSRVLQRLAGLATERYLLKLIASLEDGHLMLVRFAVYLHERTLAWLASDIKDRPPDQQVARLGLFASIFGIIEDEEKKAAAYRDELRRSREALKARLAEVEAELELDQTLKDLLAGKELSPEELLRAKAHLEKLERDAARLAQPGRARRR
jgi:hypothetical protein